MADQYFDHHYASNSDLKRLMQMIEGKESTANLDPIYEQGTLNHHALLEPHKADKSHPGYPLAKRMAETVLKDEMCRRLLMMNDCKREHEFYKQDVFGISGRCKMDAASKKLSVIFEYKGLSITTERALDDAIENFHYDQGAAWYLNCSNFKFHQYRYLLIAAVSKKEPDRLFKRLIDREHPIYLRGESKCVVSTNQWKLNFQ